MSRATGDWVADDPSGHSLAALLRAPGEARRLSLEDWDSVLCQARTANVLSRLAMDIASAGIQQDLPEPVQPHLLAALRLASHQQAGVVEECRHLATALERVGCPVVLLKGAAYALAGHPAARGRLFGDVDLLVPRASLPATEGALMLAGWISTATDPYDDRYYRQWMHELPPLTHLSRGTVVDVHHNILPTTAKRVPDAAALIEASRPVVGSVFRVLASEDQLIHSATHLFHEGELRNGLRDLLDIDALFNVCAQDPGGIQRLLERSHRLGLVWPLHLALRYAARLLGTPVPSDVLAELAAWARLGEARQAVLDGLYRRALRPQDPSGEGASVVSARWMLYLRAHALRMPLGRLSLHLGRKAVLKVFRRTSRRDP